MENLEQAKVRLEEVELKLAEFNNLIIENDPKSQTIEFEEEYRNLQDEYESLQEYIKHNEKKEKLTGDSFFNKISISLFFYFFVMFVFAFPLIVEFFSQEIILAFLSMESITSFTTLQIQTIVVLSFLIYPVGLLLINILVRLIFVRSQENKKLYFIWNLIFGGVLLLAVILSFVNLLLPIFTK